MKVGDLVRQKEKNWVGLVLSVEASRSHIKIIEGGDIYWDRMNEYEVISETR